MSERPSVSGVHHISDQVIRDGKLSGSIRETDRVVIPAKHEGANIVRTLEYLQGRGFYPYQIIVLVNGSSIVEGGDPDDTAEKALSVSPKFQVLHQAELLGVREGESELVKRLNETYGIQPERLHGKGTAMFAATLALHRADTPEDARIFFLDADIRNSFEVDPMGRLLVGATHFPSEVRVVKLASLGRDNAGISAFLSTLTGNHALIGALRWPLCGQVVVRWGDLKRMRLASGYAVEIAMLMDLIVRTSDPHVFGEVEIGTDLIDKKNTDQVHTRMYYQIMVFAASVHAFLCGLPLLTPAQMRAMNQTKPAPLWVPVHEHGLGPNQLEQRYPDAVLPSIEELFGA